jgi:single-strand DNA-binding protein
MNKVLLVGRLGNDPEVRTTQGGHSVCSFSLATTAREKVREEWKEVTEWHRVVVWGRAAEVLAQHCRKGSGIVVNGRLKTREYEDKAGVKQRVTEVICDTWYGGGYAGGRGRSDGGKPNAQGDGDFSGEIPF